MRAQLPGAVVWVLAPAVCAVVATAQTAPSQTVVLTNAAQIRSLPVARAAKAIPVHLRGVMISEAAPPRLASGNQDLRHRALVISDPTAAIYVIGTTDLLAGFGEGDGLEIDGVTDPGEFAPIVQARAARRLGSAPIPDPLPATYQKLITGDLDAQWVEVSGVVRHWESITASNLYGDWRMELAMDGDKVTVTAFGPHPAAVAPDAEVRLRCVCFYQFNESRQVLRPVLVMPRAVHSPESSVGPGTGDGGLEAGNFEVVRPAPADPFAAPVRPVAGMLQFAPNKVFGHRIHFHGTVTFQQSDRMIWMRDASGSAGIEGSVAESLQPGDVIDVLGFPIYGSPSAMLEDAVIQKRSSGPAPAPLALATPDEAFRHEADLVSVDALLEEVQPIIGGEMLTLAEQGRHFKAVLKTFPAVAAPRLPPPGSRVRVTGICVVSQNETSFTLSGVWHPESFQLLLRSADDLAVIRPPPWWTSQHVILLLGGVTGGLLLVTAVVLLLARHHVKEQERQRVLAEREFSAILSERNRLAREIHDTLAQGLVATAIQLRLAQKQLSIRRPQSTVVSPQSTGERGAMDWGLLTNHLDSAQQLVRHSLQEARNSIWNMRSQVLEEGDLAGALRDILKQMVDGSGVEARFEVAGRAHRLAPVVESNLLRVGQEAITNAAKHAQAKRISVRLEFGEKQFQLTVRDDGRGFDPARTTPGAGGFGLVGMRERVADLHGELLLRSAPGQGAEVKLTIPVAGN